METGLFIISIFSLFSIVMFIFFVFFAELFHSKEKSVYKKIFSKKFIFYNRKRYSVFYISNRVIYLNLLLLNFYILLFILFFFLEKAKAMKEYDFVITEYEKKIHFALFTTSILGINLIFIIFLIRNFIIQKKVKKIIKPFTLSEVKSLFNKLKYNDFFEFFYTKPCNETIFIKKFLVKIDKMQESYPKKNKEYRYLFYFIFYFLFSVNLMVKHKWITNENINNVEKANIKESINLFNEFFDRTFNIDNN